MKNISKPGNKTKIICRTPSHGKKPTRIELWKFDLLRSAILNTLPDSGEGLLFKELSNNLKKVIPSEKLAQLGSLSWYTTTVKLEMEVAGDIYRVANSKPQRLLKYNK